MMNPKNKLFKINHKEPNLYITYITYIKVKDY